MSFNSVLLKQRTDSLLTTHTVLRNTYILLGLTLLFSAATATLAMLTQVQPMNPVITLLGYFGLLFWTHRARHSGWGLVAVFALTGFMGYTLGPLLNYYLYGFANGSELVIMSLGATGLIFFALSAYALISRQDFSFMMGFVLVGSLVAFLASIAGWIFHVPALMLTVSALFVLVSSGAILLQTSEIIRGGETNYISATVSLYVSLYNIFVSLLHLLGSLQGRRDDSL